MTKEQEIAVLRRHQNEMLSELCEAGLRETRYPYEYDVPNFLCFNFEGAWGDLPIRGHYALKTLAEAEGAEVHFVNADSEGFPTEMDDSFAMKITDPFAQKIEAAIGAYQERMVAEGQAKILNGRFFKLA